MTENKENTEQPSAADTVNSPAVVTSAVIDPAAAPAADPAAEAELAEFRAWKAAKEAELEKKVEPEAPTAAADADAVKAENTQLKAKVIVLTKGIPEEKSDKYLKLAEAYQTEGIDLGAALDLALKDFPISTAAVPGTAANPEVPLTRTVEQSHLDSKYAGNPYYKK